MPGTRYRSPEILRRLEEIRREADASRQRDAAAATSHTLAERYSRARLVARNPLGDITIGSFIPKEAPGTLSDARSIQARVMGGIEAQSCLMNWSLRDIVDPTVWMIIASLGSRVMATLYAQFDEADVVWIRGILVDPEFPGLQPQSAMAALAILHGARMAEDPVVAVCEVRAFPDGSLDEPMRRSLDRLGFTRAPACEVHRVEGTDHDRHLIASAEWGAVGPFVRYHRMWSSVDVLERAERLLASWRLAVPDARKRHRFRRCSRFHLE